VLGVAMIVGGDGKLDRRSLVLQLCTVAFAVAGFLIPSIAGWVTGDRNSHGVALLSIPVAIVLLVVYSFVTFRNLRRHSAGHETDPDEVGWSLRLALGVLAAATVATAL